MFKNTNLENLFLYLTCTTIWGSTWLVITYQVDSASPVTSVFWRFLLSFVILIFFCVLTEKPMKYTPKQHLLFLGQGIFMFSVNYMLTYLAETMITSGLMALTFTLLLYYNIFGMWVVFRKPITWRVIVGSCLGGLGLLCIFMPEILNFDPNSRTLWGLLIGFVATFFASIGNMFSQKTYQLKIPVVVTNTYGMAYGSFFTLIVALFLGHSLVIPTTPQFLGALVYLSLFGSVIAFWAYLSLAGKIGAEKAAYSSVISPIIALTLSSLFENFHWTPALIGGVTLCILGNIFTLFPAKLVTLRLRRSR
jgi:drug/metabolite transporter (DMT)-like permease